ncbi:MAG: DUF222 domain-containing protein [Rhodococcus sp. (in: high G+C Gram-positive bacteria)]
MTSGGHDESAGPDSVDNAEAQGVSTPCAISDPALLALVEAQEALTRRIAEYDTSHLRTADRLALLVRDERVTRARIGQGHRWLAQLVAQGGFEAPGARNADALSLVLNIDRAAASRRLSDAAQLGDRTTVVGQLLEPRLPATAGALREGAIDPAHVKVIRKFVSGLPNAVDADTLRDAERHLAGAAREVRPSELSILAERIAAHIVEEGEFELPPDRVRKRGIFAMKQGSDGMVSGRFVLDPECAAYAQACASKLAKRGMCNPDDTAAPTVDLPDGEELDPEAQERDQRTKPQRLHDAFKVLMRQMLASGNLGQHRCLPVRVIITATLDDLLRGIGLGTTGTGGSMPIRDVIRMSSHAELYLALFDGEGRPLHLGRSKRIASEDQRMVLAASDRGCSAPGCERPAVDAQVHHIEEWQDGGSTDIGSLTFACDAHHPMIHDGPMGWSTSTAPPGHPYAGRTMWHPPDILDPERTGRVNHVHHPEDYLTGRGDPAA